MQKLISFLRTDIIWVATGQFIALLVGLISLKIFTHFFTAEQYAYLALLTASSAWIWMGIYQPLNQTLFRFYPVAEKQGWQIQFAAIVFNYQRKLIALVLGLLALALLMANWFNQALDFQLLITLAVIMGISYGYVHGIISFYLSQRKRKPVTIIQSFDGLFRLAGGLIGYYYFSQSEYVTAVGMVTAGVVFLILILKYIDLSELRSDIATIRTIQDEYSDMFNQYFKKIFLIMLLNASVIHLDKWLLLLLIGYEGLGSYAVIYFLAMTFASVLYFFFEMLGFPIIFKQETRQQRRRSLLLLVTAYSVVLIGIVSIVFLAGRSILVFLTTEHIAAEYESFTLLIAACGLLNLGRLLMVEGQVAKQPSRYWPAYLILLVCFIIWCLLFVNPASGGLAAALGFLIATVMFVVVTVLLNRKSIDGQKCES